MFDEDKSSIISKILVIYCGGTVGMRETPDGFQPSPGFLVKQLSLLPLFHDPLQKPLTLTLTNGQRVRYVIKEYMPLLDSSDMDHSHWIKIATDIRDQYQKFDAFVILHGTDTMAYTASALSFMFKGLNKSIILTGSQIPFDRPHSDATENVYGALMLAAQFKIPEVCIYFHHKLLRGNRTKKVTSEGFAAFNSYYPTLVEVGVHYDVRWSVINRMPESCKQLSVQTELNNQIVVCYLYPGINIKVLQSMLEPPTEGCVVMSFGSGNTPSNPEFLEVFKAAVDRGVIVVNISQCANAMTNEFYTTGKKFIRVGVVNCYDSTVEAAVAKLAVYLAKPHLSKEEIKEKLRKSTRGELTEPQVPSKHGKSKDLSNLFESLNQKLASKEMMPIIPTLLCMASAQANISVLREMVNSKYDMNLSDYDGRTALHLASENGHLEVVKFLVANGARVDVKDNFGNTSFDIAQHHRHDQICNYIKEIESKKLQFLHSNTS
jgi:lysophospholipase